MIKDFIQTDGVILKQHQTIKAKPYGVAMEKQFRELETLLLVQVNIILRL